MSRITYDTGMIRESITSGLLDLVLRPLEIISLLCVMIGTVAFFKVPIKFILSSALLFPCILLPEILMGKHLKKLAKRSQEKMGDINTILFEIITGIRIVKAFSMQKYEHDKFKKQNFGFFKLQLKTAKRDQAISPINEITASLYLILVLLLAGKQMFDGSLSYGALGAFITAIYMVFSIIKTKILLKIDYYGSPVVEVQRGILRLKKSSLRLRKYELILMPLLMFPLLPLYAKVQYNFDIYNHIPFVLAVSVVMLAISYIIVVLIYKYFYDKKFKKVEKFLKELEDFENDKGEI